MSHTIKTSASRTLLFAWVALTCLPAGGCMFFTSRKEGDALIKQVKALKSQMAEITKQGLASLKKDVAELKELLPQARALLLQNSARFGATVDRIEEELRLLKGQMDNLMVEMEGAQKADGGVKGQLASLTQTVEQLRVELTRLIAEVRRPEPEPSTPGELFARASIRRLSGKYPEARRDYQTLIQKFPADPRVDEAYYEIARGHFATYEFKAAAASVAALLKARPNSRYEAAARLLSAKSHFELKECQTAMRILTRLVRTHPQDEAIPEARRVLSQLQKVQNVSRFCTR